jgi:hypothetical protein
MRLHDEKVGTNAAPHPHAMHRPKVWQVKEERGEDTYQGGTAPPLVMIGCLPWAGGQGRSKQRPCRTAWQIHQAAPYAARLSRLLLPEWQLATNAGRTASAPTCCLRVARATECRQVQEKRERKWNDRQLCLRANACENSLS